MSQSYFPFLGYGGSQSQSGIDLLVLNPWRLYRANESGHPYVDGDPVTGWEDVVTTPANPLTTTNAPTFKTNILNGLPVVRFNGTSNWLQEGTRSIYSIFHESAHSLAIVFFIKADTTANQILIATNDITNTAKGFTFYFRPAFQSLYHFASNGSTTLQGFALSGAIPYGTWHTAIFTFDGSAWRYKVDDGIIETDSKDAAIVVGDPQLAPLVGERGNSPSLYLNGDIPEIAFWNRELTDAEINQARDILKAKYAL